MMTASKKTTKYIFVSGGVISGLGKGVTAASLGFLLKNRGYSVTNLKCENYLNIDSGNINPIEHGDVFLCEDGTEADLDLGTYERFLGQEVGAVNYTTIGQIYQKVIDDAKNLKYNGATVEAIPHVPEEAMRRIEAAGKGFDICLVELGGTAGEYQNVVYFEAYRIMKLKKPTDVIHVHVTYFPKPEHINELKSKPTQLSVRQLQSMGIQPDFIVGRSPVPIDKKRKEKVAYFCNMLPEDVISNPDMETIYELPLEFAAQDFDKKALTKLGLPIGRSDLADWKEMVEKLLNPSNKEIAIGIVAKFAKIGDSELQDSYASLLEALGHAATVNDAKLKIRFVAAEELEAGEKKVKELLQDLAGIVAPVGWSTRGLEGKMAAIKYARENKVPFLGLCYGMQLAAIEFARDVAKLQEAAIGENDGEGKNMRLGGYDCVLKPGSQADKIYGAAGMYKNGVEHLISERHRHRFEFNNLYREPLEKAGLVISGTSPDDMLVEMIELPKSAHPFFMATQAHPEYKSRPLVPHPLFAAFVAAAKK